MLGEVLKTSRMAFVQENAQAFLVYRRASVLGLPGASDVVYLQDHLDYLSSEQNLLLLANQGLDHMLLLHVYRGKEGRKKKKNSINHCALTLKCSAVISKGGNPD